MFKVQSLNMIWFGLIVTIVLLTISVQYTNSLPMEIYDDLMDDEKILYRMAELIDSLGSFDDDDDEFRPIARNKNPTDLLPMERCVQPVRKGVCRALIPRWSYDPATKECKEFKFGGCDGNGNNFNTQKQCMDICKGKDV